MAEGLYSADNQNEQNGKTHTSSLPLGSAKSYSLQLAVYTAEKQHHARAYHPFLYSGFDVRMRNVPRGARGMNSHAATIKSISVHVCNITQQQYIYIYSSVTWL